MMQLRVLPGLLEVFIEDCGERFSVAKPVFGGRVIVETGSTVAVEFVDGSIDAVTLEPAFAERAGITKGRACAALGKPGVLAEELLEAGHALEIIVKVRDGRAADVQFAVSIVVQFQRETGLLAGGDLF